MAFCLERLGPVRGWAPCMQSLPALALGSALLVCGGFAPLFGQGNTATADQADVLRGTVMNGLTREPIGRALVVSPDNRFATMTDDRGRFEFRIPPVDSGHADQASGAPGAIEAGTRQPQPVANNRPNFLTARKNGFLFDNSGMQGVSITPEQSDVTIALVPEARIVGHVILAGSEEANGMRVQLYRRQVLEGSAHWVPTGNAEVRSDGEFRFADLSAGSYKVFTEESLDRDPVTSNRRAQVFGYPPVYYPAAADFVGAAVIQLAAGETFQASLSPVKREYYPVKIGVTNGAVGVQLEVEVWRQGHEGPGYSLGYNFRDGTIGGSLPNGNYTVQVVSRGTSSSMGIANISVNGGPLSGAMMTLVPSVAIILHVTEQFQHPVNKGTAGFTIDSRSFTANERRPNYLHATLVPVEEFGLKPTYSLRPPTGPEDESLVFENVPPGRYRVHVESGIGYVAAIDCGGADLQRVPLDVGFGASPPPIEITVRDDGGEVRGSIDGLSNSTNRGGVIPGTQLAGIVYFVPMTDGGQMKQAWFQRDGSFQVQQVSPGTYRVLAFEQQQPELEFANQELMSRFDSKAQLISIVAGQSENLRVSLITANE
jgi:hypothetical protein